MDNSIIYALLMSNTFFIGLFAFLTRKEVKLQNDLNMVVLKALEHIKDSLDSYDDDVLEMARLIDKNFSQIPKRTYVFFEIKKEASELKDTPNDS